jgi:hypothetical protein
MIPIKKINNEKVIVLNTKEENYKQNKGYKICPKLNANIFLVGRKASGKSSVINTILHRCIDKDTFVYGFVSTHLKDPTYIAIKEWMDKKEIKYEFHDNIIDGKINYLAVIIDKLKKEVEAIPLKEEEKEETIEEDPYNNYSILEEEEIEEGIKIKYKKKLKTPKYIFLFDDMSEQLKNTQVSVLLKNHRHYISKCIVSSQYPLDLKLDGRKQIDIWILFSGMQLEKLQQIYFNSDIRISFELFLAMYQQATLTQYSFFYMMNGMEFRERFDKKFLI